MNKTAPHSPTDQEIFAESLKNRTASEQELLDFLRTHTIDPNMRYRGDRLLHMAIRRGFHTLIEELINQGADLEAPGTANNTALHEALNTDTAAHPGIAIMLLARGARTSSLNVAMATPLHFYLFRNLDGVHNQALEEALVTAPDFHPHHILNAMTLLEKCISGDRLSSFGHRLLKEGAPIPYRLIHHDELGERYHDAQCCWEKFALNHDVRLLTHDDIILLSNYNVLDKVFIPSLWEQHLDLLRAHLADMPGWMSHEILNLQPGLHHILTASPDYHINTLSAYCRKLTPPPEQERTA